MKRVAFALLLAVSISLPVQAGIFLHIPDIEGDSIDALHPNEIVVLSWAQSVANLNNMPVVMPLVFTHAVDKASPKLVEAAILGTDLVQATLSVTMEGPTRFDYIILILTQPRVVSVRSDGVEGVMPVETVTLTCQEFGLLYREIPGGPIVEAGGSCGN